MPCHVSTRSLHDLVNNKFAKADLFGKMVNISGEIPTGTLPPDQVQELSGADLITAERKYGQPFQFVNYAKLIFAGNWTPKGGDCWSSAICWGLSSNERCVPES